MPQAKNSILFLSSAAYKLCSSDFQMPSSLQVFFRDTCVSTTRFSTAVRRASFKIVPYLASQCLWSSIQK